MSESIKFDILLTYYGRFEYFRECVGSILNQTYSNFRLIVVDDNFPGDDAKIYLESLADPRIEYYKNEKNLGIIPNFKNALQYVKNDYFLFPGSDDILKPNHLFEAVNSINKFSNDSSTISIYSPSFSNINANGEEIHFLIDKIKHICFWIWGARTNKQRVLQGDSLTASLARSYWVQWPCLFFNKSVLEIATINEEFKNNADQVFLFEILLKNKKSLIVNNKRTISFRRHSDSGNAKVTISGTRWNEDIKMYRLYEEWAKVNNSKKTVKASKNHFLAKINRIIGKHLVY